jgi:transposase-like protein
VERRNRYSRKFQRIAVERMRTCESVDELAKELGVTRRCLYKWRTKLEAVAPGEEAARPSTHASAQRKEILLPFQQAGYKANTFIHNRTLLPRHHSLP